jgi:presenilin-like A22 family membrane protease
LLPFLKADQRPQRDAALRMLVALVATLTVFVLLMFEAGGTVNHQGTYVVQVLATMCAFTVLTLRALPLAFAFIAAQAVTVSATYAFTLKHDPALWPLLAICIATTFALVGYSLSPSPPQRR